MQKRKFNPKSVRGSKAMKKAGLVAPVTASEKSNFAKIQKQWYAKLKQENFKDLEWVDHRTGKGQNSDFLKHSLTGGKPYHAERDLYYQLASNYLQHCRNKSLRGYELFIWKLHAAGHTYEDINAALKKTKFKKVSLYTLFYDLQAIVKKCYAWNNTHAEGLLTKRREDKERSENTAVEEFDQEEYNWLINKEYAYQISGGGHNDK